MELTDNPELGPLQPAYGENVRSLSLKPYVVLYRISGDDVFIERIVHGARLPKNIQ